MHYAVKSKRPRSVMVTSGREAHANATEKKTKIKTALRQFG